MAPQPDGQSCKTCAYFIKETCRRKLPEIITPGLFGWMPCDPSDWCFYWKEETKTATPAVAVQPIPGPAVLTDPVALPVEPAALPAASAVEMEPPA